MINSFTWKNGFLCFLSYIWVKQNFEVIIISLVDNYGSRTVGNKEVSSENNLTSDSKLSRGSLMYIKKISGPNVKPCGTPPLIDNQDDNWSLSTTLWNLLFRKYWNNRPSRQPLSNAFEMSKKLPITSSDGLL